MVLSTALTLQNYTHFQSNGPTENIRTSHHFLSMYSGENRNTNFKCSTLDKQINFSTSANSTCSTVVPLWCKEYETRKAYIWVKTFIEIVIPWHLLNHLWTTEVLQQPLAKILSIGPNDHNVCQFMYWNGFIKNNNNNK